MSEKSIKSKNVRVIVGIILIVCIAIILTAIGMSMFESPTKDDKFYNENDQIQVVDGANRKVSLTKPAETMATSWGGVVDSYMFALGLTDNIVGTRSGNNLHKLCMPNIENVPSVGRYTLDKEALADLHPDVFIHSAASVDILGEANKVGVPAIGIDTNTLDGINDAVLLIGTIFGVNERAEYVSDYYNNILSIVDKHTKDIPESEYQEVVVLAHSAGEIASNANSVLDEMIERAGGISSSKKYLADEDGKYPSSSSEVGQEIIMEWNPDYIFTQECTGEFTAETVLAMDVLTPMTAVQNQHVYSIPCVADAWYTSTPSACLGVLYMSMQLYPDYYGDINFEQIVLDFYRDIYGLNMTKEELGF